MRSFANLKRSHKRGKAEENRPRRNLLSWTNWRPGKLTEMLLAIDGLRLLAILLAALRDMMPTSGGSHGIALGLLCRKFAERLD